MSYKRKKRHEVGWEIYCWFGGNRWRWGVDLIKINCTHELSKSKRTVWKLTHRDEAQGHYEIYFLFLFSFFDFSKLLLIFFYSLMSCVKERVWRWTSQLHFKTALITEKNKRSWHIIFGKIFLQTFLLKNQTIILLQMMSASFKDSYILLPKALGCSSTDDSEEHVQVPWLVLLIFPREHQCFPVLDKNCCIDGHWPTVSKGRLIILKIDQCFSFITWTTYSFLKQFLKYQDFTFL